MTTQNEIKPAAPAEALDGGRCAVDAGFGELFAPEEVAMDSPKLAWMKRHGILTWYDSGMRDGFRACPDEWFAGFQAWWPDKSGIDFFAHETAHNGDSRIGEGDTEEKALANLMTCWDARKTEMKLWHAESSPNIAGQPTRPKA